jgi:CheY-like chemotaxis protein
VLVAANGAEAVALFAQNIDRVDLVLTDMMMPVMDGPATILALRQIRSDVRIIGASGIENNSMLARAVGAGVSTSCLNPTWLACCCASWPRRWLTKTTWSNDRTFWAVTHNFSVVGQTPTRPKKMVL